MSKKTRIPEGPISRPTRLILDGKDRGVFHSRTKARLAAKRSSGEVKFQKGDLDGDIIVATTKKVVA